MSKMTAWVLAGVASVWLIAVDFPGYAAGDWGTLASSLTGLAMIVAGAIAAVRRPENRTGAILLLTAFLWGFKGLHVHTGVLYQQLSFAAEVVWAVPLAYLMLAFPSGRLERRKDVWICALATIPAFWLKVLQLPFFTFTPTTAEISHARAQAAFDAVRLVMLAMALALVGAAIASVREK